MDEAVFPEPRCPDQSTYFKIEEYMYVRCPEQSVHFKIEEYRYALIFFYLYEARLIIHPEA